ncbi:CGNR zinc finger domain-containing protein [Roseospira visakhapatnamensis]|uniref:Putative RNA-binding Zn ribbon-like protein n=1 Tax=Roseospira visakhapatnamensis TaxID=390880 RepID=A0A7W6RFM3_9PROT|nr:CGNR zinc finger domain-containing protein [Roseospira visakhapatnamensis]MBB4267685.1 putative RNA-binding Zn ribbon-like protein [Roseospira visakhapatnamensis]
MHAWQRTGFFGGHVALDFVNTVNDEGKTRDRDALPDWPIAVAWAVEAEVITTTEAEALAEVSDADRALGDLVAFREAVWRLLSAVAGDAAPAPEDARAVSAVIAGAHGLAALGIESRVARWRIGLDRAGADLIRARLALTLAALLASPELARVRECGRCTGLYLDHGRGRGRRWCRMSGCGNRAKAERFRARA